VSKQWEDIGFQGADPATDFRGMGVLGLRCLTYLTAHYGAQARAIVVATELPYRGYPLAITVFQIGEYAMHLVRSRAVQAYLAATAEAAAALLPAGTEAGDAADTGLQQYLDIVARLVFWFDSHWIAAKPRNLMDFPAVFKSFQAVVKRRCDFPPLDAAALFPPCPLPPAPALAAAAATGGGGGAAVGGDGGGSFVNPLAAISRVASPPPTPGGAAARPVSSVV